MRGREPVARPLDIVAVELLLTASQAFLVGVLLYLAVGFWEDRGVGLGSASAVVILMGVAVGCAWLYWLAGGVGWPMAAARATSATSSTSGAMISISGASLMSATSTK